MRVLGASVLTGAVVLGALPLAPSQAAEPYNYAEALQKSIYFYDAEKSGPGVTGGRLPWRGDSQLSDVRVPLGVNGTAKNMTNLSEGFIARNLSILDPDGNGSVDVSGGFHDAGDHVKFGLPQSYAASTLGWGFYEFRDAFRSSGQEEHMLEVLRWFSDYFLRSTFRDAQGNVAAFSYMVGDGGADHSYWGPPELQDPVKYPRPATFATAEKPASDQAAGAAAALAIMSLNVKGSDAAYAARCLDTAAALYRFAQQYRGLGNSDGFYNSSADDDELAWAAVWLYSATGENHYLQDVTGVSGTSYTGYLKKIMSSTTGTWKYTWTHSWDTVWSGVVLRLAELFPANSQYTDSARWNLEYWSGGKVPHTGAGDSAYIARTPAGFSFATVWGSARYNASAQMLGLIYEKHQGGTAFTEWAKGQMEYLMGRNPMGYSYIVGFPSPELAAKHPHHRAAHGSTTNNLSDPATNRHVLWGALVGGPDGSDKHNDLITDYVQNEVAIDYNAGLVGALAGLYGQYGQGQLPLPNFPPEANNGGTTAPAAPAGLTASAGNAQAGLSWNASAGAVSYTVKRAATSGGPYTTVAAGVTGTSYTDTGLSNGTTYYYVVTAVNTAGSSANSAQASVTPAGTAPQPTGSLVVQYRAGNTNPADNTIAPHVNIKNTGTTAVKLSDLKVRYYFTKDGSQALSSWVDWAQIGSGNVNRTFGTAAGTGADTYVELSFADTAGSIPAGGQTGDIQLRIAKSDWSSFNEAGDYSFDPSKTAYADWSKVTLYQGGTLVWGTQP
ncbi:MULTISPECIES: glycoside hydrolase family 9 protein [Paenibacillus]|uniref:glycoside hydrolase family 9 protein n=1 Tax=Paenibacillus TaxID=44249 RepID=UPI0022B8B138|nr:glycoside hydrolase family 9 protein [Paenibacillus caseinilyticus]MCZ8520328.1 glycoside hydrolase family 9 protein [Paenibacillus caseinilyticus]